MSFLNRIISRNNSNRSSISSSNSEDSEDDYKNDYMPRYPTRYTGKLDDESEVLGDGYLYNGIDPDTLQSLVGIAVDILKQNIDNENQTMTNLISIAVDILKQTVGPPASKSSIYTMPEQDMRFSDLTLTVTDTDKGEKQPELLLSTITVKYDARNKLKITGYDIKNGDAGDGIYKKIIDELNLGEINLADLKEPSKKQQIIKNIVDRLKKEFNIGDEEYKKIEEYLEKLAEAVSNLKKKCG